jgi:ABC-type glycerol-3-phosphate transport system substrate-binding protein
MKKRSLKKVALTLAAALAASAVLTACSSKTGGSDTHQQRQGVPREQRVRPEKRAAAKRIR